MIESLYKRWRKLQPPGGRERYAFLDEVSRYLWNGWGTTIDDAAARLAQDEEQWAKTHIPFVHGLPVRKEK